MQLKKIIKLRNEIPVERHKTINGLKNVINEIMAWKWDFSVWLTNPNFTDFSNIYCSKVYLLRWKEKNNEFYKYHKNRMILQNF